jgi:hypothetical protein
VSERMDVGAAIEVDLRGALRERRRFFAVALASAVVICGATLAAIGTRGDLWAQPRGLLVLQVAVWILGLGVLPSVGIGLIFPRRAALICAAIGSVGVGIIASVASEMATLGGLGLSCAALVLMVGAALVGVAAVSGALTQRERVSSALWVAGGVSLTSLGLITWHCAPGSWSHLLVGHLGATAALLVIAGGLAVIVHRRQRAAMRRL